jgi:hypothetical protein
LAAYKFGYLGHLGHLGNLGGSASRVLSGLGGSLAIGGGHGHGSHAPLSNATAGLAADNPARSVTRFVPLVNGTAGSGNAAESFNRCRPPKSDSISASGRSTSSSCTAISTSSSSSTGSSASLTLDRTDLVVVVDDSASVDDEVTSVFNRSLFKQDLTSLLTRSQIIDLS